MRCFHFMTLPCKMLVTGHGNVPEERTLDKFVGYARDSPKLVPFLSQRPRHVQFGEITASKFSSKCTH